MKEEELYKKVEILKDANEKLNELETRFFISILKDASKITICTYRLEYFDEIEVIIKKFFKEKRDEYERNTMNIIYDIKKELNITD